ncbi:MAG: phage tail protein [Acidobacteria bacterium]|nr:phage tail protein [Acidobacteriota bacterium]
MPEYLSPGVYVEEVASGPRPIEGVGTSTAGFVGLAERGPTLPRLVTSWGDYLRWFGDTLDPLVSYMPFGVRGFFDNGGQRAFIARVVGAGAAPAGLDLATSVANNVLRITATGPGIWGNHVLLRVQASTQNSANWFRITLLYYVNGIPTPFVDPLNPANQSNPQRREPDVLEDYDNLTALRGRSNFAEAVINSASKLVQVEYVNTGGGAVAPGRPANTAFAPSTAAFFNLPTADPNTALRIQAVTSGAAANAVTVAVANGTNANSFAVTITDAAGVAQTFDNIPDNTPAQAIAAVNASPVVRASWFELNAPTAAPPSRPNNVAATNLAAGTDGSQMAGGGNGAAITPGDFSGNPALAPNLRTGLAGLATIDEVNMLLAPDEVNGTIANNNQITAAVISQCELLKERFAILSIAAGQGLVQNIQPPQDTTYGAVYYPWIRVFDTRSQDSILIPPAGHVAGIYARTDIERGVHKAPANEVVRGIVNQDLGPTRKPVEFQIVKGEHDILNPRGVNVIRDFRPDGRGIRVWGARTMSSDPLWKYVNVRRLFLFVEESIDEGTQWVVFEPNDDALWARVRQVITNFLTTVWRSGALFGLTAAEAFFVRCGRDTMTADDIDNGRLICEIGIAPVKPAEFVIFRIQQKTLDLQA